MSGLPGLAPTFAYAPSLESATALDVRERYGLFIGNAWTSAENDATFASIAPATEATLARVAHASAADVDRAVRAARRGYEKYWRKLRPAERAKYVYRIARALGERAREFSIAECLDVGKPIREAREFDVAQAVAHVFYHAGWADKLIWAVRGPDRVRALGVVGAIVSADFPLLSAIRKIAPALACGNTVVLKPSPDSPLTALLLADLCAQIELPPGVLNVVTGDDATGVALTEHPDVDAIVFTGSAIGGKAVRRATAGMVKRLALDLGGKSTYIVFDDAPLDQAIEGIVAAAYFNAGHAGSAGSRVFVQESIAGELVERLRARLATLRHGDPLDKNTDIGAIRSRERLDRILAYVRGGIEDGATLVRASWTPPENGFWYPASFFTGVAPTAGIAREPSVGPLLCVMTFRTPGEAIERANNLPGGLAAGVWTASGALALHVAQRLASGVVWCNTFNRFDPSAPFGGLRESGVGRDGGLAGLRTYLDT